MSLKKPMQASLGFFSRFSLRLLSPPKFQFAYRKSADDTEGEIKYFFAVGEFRDIQIRSKMVISTTVLWTGSFFPPIRYRVSDVIGFSTRRRRSSLALPWLVGLVPRTPPPPPQTADLSPIPMTDVAPETVAAVRVPGVWPPEAPRERCRAPFHMHSNGFGGI